MMARAAILAMALALGRLGVLLADPAPVAASCVVWGTDEEMLAAAGSVFVGRVTALTNDDRWAMVAVEEIWWGPDLASVVEVRGGEPPGAGSSVDRQYAAPQRYLFAVALRDGILRDTACSMTQPWDETVLGRLRPLDVRTAQTDVNRLDADGAGSAAFDLRLVVLPTAIVVLAGIVVFGAARLLRSRGEMR
jgi:hypothetical protein